MELKQTKTGNLTRKVRKLTIHQYSGAYRPVVSVSIFAFAFLSTLLISSSFTPVQDSSAEDIAAVLNSSGYFINLVSGNGGTVAMDLATTAGGSIGIAKDSINIKSNAPSGYDLYLSMDNSDTDGNRLYKDGIANPNGSSTTNPYLSPTSGTFSNPAVLDTNSWGYALANTTVGLPSGTAFDAEYNTARPSETALFAGVPLGGSDQLIQSITTPDATNGIDTNIYYGVKANTTLPSGSYKGTVTYTAIAKTNSTLSEQTSVSPSVTTKLEGGELITIATMLNINAADAEDPGDPANNIPEKKVSVTIGGQACTNIQLSNAQDGSLQISCSSPSMATGRYDVGIDVPKYDKFWVIVNGIQYKYTEQDQNDAINSAVGQVTGGNATTNDILSGKTAFVGGVEITGTMPSYTVQYDSNKTEQENTQDAGLTWSSDNKTLTIAEGYHTQQQVDAPSGFRIVTIGSSNSNANRTFNIKNELPDDYQNLTVDNFYTIITGKGVASSGTNTSGMTRSYNASTGVLTVTAWSQVYHNGTEPQCSYLNYRVVAIY